MSTKAQRKKKEAIAQEFVEINNETRKSRVSIANEKILIESSAPADENFKVLSTNCIVLRGEDHEKLLLKERQLNVPPSSPRSDIIFGEELKTLPRNIPDVSNLKIPSVRVVGIKKCIQLLGEFFGCKQYKTNLLHFWFLDIVTDCIWRCQDEFLLTEEYQKIVLGWVINVFDIIRDPKNNFSRGKFFRLFREAMIIAEDRIEAGDILLPAPKNLFNILRKSDEPVSFETLLTDSTDSSLSSSDSESEKSYLVIPSDDYPELPDFYKLPRKDCKCDVSVTSSIETLSEKSIYIADEEDDISQKGDEPHYNSEADVNDNMVSFSVSDFYQPTKKLHSRFTDELSDEDDESAEEDVTRDESEAGLQYEWVNEIEIPKPIQKPKSVVTLNSYALTEVSIHSSNKRMKSKMSKTKTDKKSNIDLEASSQNLQVKKQTSKIIKEEKVLTEEEILRAWFEYNIWEQRTKDMSSPTRGWLPSTPTDCGDSCICGQTQYSTADLENDEYIEMKNEWLQYLKKYKQSIDQTDQKKFINSCLLLIIKQFIFEYFYESFQYKLIKMAFQIPPNLILERLNSKWPIPKLCKDDFKRPVVKKPKVKKDKKKKSKKSKKKGKKSKKSKSSRSSKSTRSSRSSRSSKSTKSSKSKKGKKDKLKKKHKLSKEEKAEIQRLKREERMRLEEELAREEHRRFIFPLKLAVEEQFFKSIFLNYVTPSKGARKKKSKKDKKGKKGKKHKKRK